MSFSSAILKVLKQFIQQSEGNSEIKFVPWWKTEWNAVIKS